AIPVGSAPGRTTLPIGGVVAPGTPGIDGDPGRPGVPPGAPPVDKPGLPLGIPGLPGMPGLPVLSPAAVVAAGSPVAEPSTDSRPDGSDARLCACCKIGSPTLCATCWAA